MKYKIISTRNELIQLIPKFSIGVEIGVFKGEFSKVLLEGIQPELLYLIDPWEGLIGSGDKDGNNVIQIDGNSYYINNIIPEFLFIPNVKLLRHYSDVINLFPDSYLDWIYIDGLHEYESIKYDLETSFSKIKYGGYIMGHDYNAISFPGVVLAVNEFCTKYGLEIEYLTQDGCPSYLISKK